MYQKGPAEEYFNGQKPGLRDRDRVGGMCPALRKKIF
jgi:hypothetical protein